MSSDVELRLRMTLLDRLLGADELRALAIDELASSLGHERDDVLTALDQLTADGCVLVPDGQGRLALREAGLGVWRDYLEHTRRQAGRAGGVDVYRSTSSTQDVARRAIKAQGKAADGSLIVAHEQTEGRGRLGRRWHSPAGAVLTFSYVSCPARQPATTLSNRLSVAVAVALAEALDRLSGRALPHPDAARIKWPNDLIARRRKLAGILIETVSIDEGVAAIVGVGVNTSLRPDDLPSDAPFREHVIGLADLGCRLGHLRILAQLDAALAHACSTLADDHWPARWRSRSTLGSDPITVFHNGRTYTGEVVDLDPDEGLILRTETGTIVYLPAATSSLAGG